MTENRVLFYEKRISLFKDELSKVKQQLLAFALFRLVLFLAIIAAIYFLRAHTNLVFVFGIGGVLLFIYTVALNSKTQLKKRKLEHLVALNKKEIRVIHGDLTDLDEGMRYIGENHPYNQDIDLFGYGSFFQRIDRSATPEGKDTLAKILNENSIERVPEKQEAIKELGEKPEWRQNFQTIAALIKTKISSADILKWLNTYKPTISSAFKFLPLIWSVICVAILVGYGLDLVHQRMITICFFTGLTITGLFLGKINLLYQSASEMTETFRQYSALLKEIEKEEFTSTILKEQQQKIRTQTKPASAIFESLSKNLNGLSQRNNFVFAIIANAFFLWDLKYAWRVENWMKQYGSLTETWYDVIAFTDAYNSLGNYAFNQPSHIYPVIDEAPDVVIKAKNLGHPLLNAEQRVNNDFVIEKPEFFIITGANMAGKSTFLRTVGLNLVLANTGLPICAERFSYRPIRLISSMRTTDSLYNDESYFFSELKRLKYITQEIEKETYFIILDEILKGTNSKDKAEGSQKFVERLVGTGSTGLIATHDLSLCKLSETYKQIKNYYFDAEIVDNELYFDYRFKDGVCKNMNASFLLRKMEII